MSESFVELGVLTAAVLSPMIPAVIAGHLFSQWYTSVLWKLAGVPVAIGCAAIVGVVVSVEVGFLGAAFGVVLSFHKERIPPFTAGVNPTLADQSTDDTLAGYSTVIHNY